MTTQITYNRSKVTLAGGVVRIVSVAAQGPAGPANAPIADQTVLGNVSGAAAVPVALSVPQIKTLLALETGDISGLGALAALNTVGAAQIDAGAITSTKIATDAVTTAKLVDGAVTLAKIVSIGAGVLLGSVAGGTPTELSFATVKGQLAITAADVTGLGDLATANYADLGLGGAAFLGVGTTAGTVASGDDSRITGAAQKAQNLADLADAATARSNLGVAIGSNVQAYDADLAAIAALTTAPYGRSLLTLADAAAGRTSFGLGTAAVKDTGTSGTTVPLLDGANGWSAVQTLQAGLALGSDSDLYLYRDAANTLAQRNGANAQAAYWYASYTDASNYQRAILDAGKTTANMVTIGAGNAGTGAAMGLQFAVALTAGGGPTNIANFNTSGHLAWNTDNTYDIGATTASRPRTIYVGSNAQLGATGSLIFAGRSRIKSSADGLIELWNASTADFSRLNFGGTTSASPALKKSSAALHARLADDSDYAEFAAKYLTVPTGTITASTPALNITQTWNSSGVTFIAASVAVTNTASATTSKLLDLSVGGTSKFAVFFDGQVSSSTITSSGNVAAGTAGGFTYQTFDLYLMRDAANVFAQRNGTTSQAYRVYSTYTDTSNYERFSLDWKTTANWLRLATENAGTGSARNMALISAGGIIGIGGTTSSFPALKRNSAALEARLADDSAYAQFNALQMAIVDGVTAPGATSGLAKIYVDTADGDLKIIFSDGTIKTIVVDT